MREKDIERKLKMEVGSHGGICWKFVSLGTAGVPDRIILMPKGKIFATESAEVLPGFQIRLLNEVVCIMIVSAKTAAIPVQFFPA